MATEKERRVYYQHIVYGVCNVLDLIDGKGQTPGDGVVCGTADHPSTEVSDRMNLLAQEIQRLRALSADSPGSAFRPIESAPKDGTMLLLCRVTDTPYVGFWCKHANVWVEAGTGGWREPTFWAQLPPRESALPWYEGEAKRTTGKDRDTATTVEVAIWPDNEWSLLDDLNRDEVMTYKSDDFMVVDIRVESGEEFEAAIERYLKLVRPQDPGRTLALAKVNKVLLAAHWRDIVGMCWAAWRREKTPGHPYVDPTGNRPVSIEDIIVDRYFEPVVEMLWDISDEGDYRLPREGRDGGRKIEVRTASDQPWDEAVFLRYDSLSRAVCKVESPAGLAAVKPFAWSRVKA